jgi:hypothetical protein
MNAGSALRVAQEWVAAHGSRTPGFCAAHLMGSLLTIPPEAEFPASGDVDLNLIVDRDQPTETFNIPWQGLILEYSVVSRSQYATPEAVLANPELACNLAQDTILADRDGSFRVLQREVQRRYGEQQWVTARCAAEKRIVEGFLQQVDGAKGDDDAAFAANGAALFLSGLLATADGLAPTHRRCLVLMRQRLEVHGRLDLFAEALDLSGYARLTRGQVESCLDDCAMTFDRAVQVRRSPCMFPFKFQPHVRPYIIDGPRAMIEEGDYREAMLWIEGWLVFSNQVIQADAPEAERPVFREKLRTLWAAKGVGIPGLTASRRERAHRLAGAVFDLCDHITEQIPA